MFSSKFYRSAAFALAGMAFGAIGLNAGAAPSLQLSLVYVGHTTANNQTGITGTAADLSDPSFETTAVHHYFDVYAKFNDDSINSSSDFRAAVFDINFGSQVQAITQAGVAGGTTNKYFGNNPVSNLTAVNMFSTNGDGGTAGDDKAITALQSDPSAQQQTLIAEPGAEMGFTAGIGSRLGRFSMGFTGPLSADTFVSVSPQVGGGNFSYFVNNLSGTGTVVTPPSDPTGATGGTFVIPAPEPGSLSLVAAGLGLLGLRRRKAAQA